MVVIQWRLLILYNSTNLEWYAIASFFFFFNRVNVLHLDSFFFFFLPDIPYIHLWLFAMKGCMTSVSNQIFPNFYVCPLVPSSTLKFTSRHDLFPTRFHLLYCRSIKPIFTALFHMSLLLRICLLGISFFHLWPEIRHNFGSFLWHVND